MEKYGLIYKDCNYVVCVSNSFVLEVAYSMIHDHIFTGINTNLKVKQKYNEPQEMILSEK